MAKKSPETPETQETQKNQLDDSISFTKLKFLLQKVYFYYFYADKSTLVNLIRALLNVIIAWLKNQPMNSHDIQCISTFVRDQESLIPREMPSNRIEHQLQIKRGVEKDK